MKCFRPRPQGSNWNVNWLTRMVQTCDELVNEQVCDGSGGAAKLLWPPRTCKLCEAYMIISVRFSPPNIKHITDLAAVRAFWLT